LSLNLLVRQSPTAPDHIRQSATTRQVEGELDRPLTSLTLKQSGGWQLDQSPNTVVPQRESNMDALKRQQLVRQRSVAKGSLTRMQTFIETGDRILNDMQVRFEELSNIYNKIETAQNELQLFDDVDHSADRLQIENQYFAVKAKFDELLHTAVSPPLSRHSSSHSSSSRHTHVSHHSSNLMKLSVLSLPNFEGKLQVGFIIEIFSRL